MVRAHGNAPHPVGVPRECALARSRSQIPNPAVDIDVGHALGDSGHPTPSVASRVGMTHVARTHRTVLLFEPNTTFLLSGLKATLVTNRVCPSSLDVHVPASRSQILICYGFGAISHPIRGITQKYHFRTHRTVPSPEPDTTVLLSEPMATPLTQSVCSLRVALHAPDSRTHTLQRKM